MFFSKSTALKAILPVAGIALAAGIIGAAAPAQAMPIMITIDDFETSGARATNGTQTATPLIQNDILPGSPLGSINRTISLSSLKLPPSPLPTSPNPNRANRLDLDGGIASLLLAQNHQGTATLNYTFNSFNFTERSRFAFNYDYDYATSSSPVTFTFTLGTSTGPLTLSNTYLSGTQVAGEQIFDFGNYDLTAVSSARLEINGGNGNDINISSPITARRVPVPPAILATGVGAVIGGLKASRKRKQVAVMA